MTDPTHHNPLSDSLLDYLRGDADPAEAARVEAALARDPALRKERDRLAAFLALATSAHAVETEPGAASRVAARVRAQALHEEERAAREAARPARSSPRTIWARVLAISVGVHVLALGLLSLKIHEESKSARPARPPFSVVWPVEIAETEEEPAVAGDEGTLRYDGKLRIEDLLPREALADLHVPPADLDAPLQSPDPRLDPFLPAVRRQMLFRTVDELKRVALQSAGVADADASLGKVQALLRFLGRSQRPDGSWLGTSGEPSVRATAVALLAFAGDGHSARTDGYGAVVARGLEWLRANAKGAGLTSDRAAALYALTEDYMLSNGVMTPAESAERTQAIAALASTVKVSPKGDDGVWAPLAMAAVSRAGLAPAAGSVERSTRWADGFLATTDAPELAAPKSDPRSTLLDGLALLLATKSKASRFPTFPTWNGEAWSRLAGMIAADGGVLRSNAPGDASRVETSAVIALGLELAYRTF